MPTPGKVYITGAGPGDEKLITLKALECIKIADVVIYDYLVNVKFLDYCKPGCQKVYAGKKASNHTLEQEVINETIVRYALEGKTVVRLKGGDPYVFGRGGEEVLALVEKDIPFEVIPGITSGIAVPSYAGIPVTHRDSGSTLTFITGHESIKKRESDVDYETLAKLRGTLVFYMGVKNLSNIAQQLVHFGKRPETPVALIRWGTTSRQQTLTGTLADIAEKVEATGFKPPALIVIGEAVGYRDQLLWFEKKPLFGKRIMVTRSRKQASKLSKGLADLGADVVELPTIDIQPCEDFTALDSSIQKLNTYGWVVFTSVNAVEIFMHRLYHHGKDTRALASCKLAVIGEETGAELHKHGLCHDLLPEQYTSDSVIEAFRKNGSVKDCKVLLPTSEIAHDNIPNTLREMGAIVDVVPAYKNITPEYSTDYLAELFSEPFDVVTFTSSSTVINLAELLAKHGLQDKLAGIKGVSIGPITSKSAQYLSIDIVAEAKPHTINALVEAVVGYLKHT
ncbi:MAG: uroporphyrinogen-III C-methyltransferase [Bacteroidota bacterium]|nr:uroporphyrinogen-III C-methyltransferase [Bacteroidota bacterium]